MTFTEFIIEHENDDCGRLLLSASRWPDIDMPKAVSCIECRRKMKHKVPAWYALPELIYPDTLCTEQCSSAATASLKTRVVSELVLQDIDIPERDALTAQKCACLLDLTGGLGVDSWHFSKHFDKVVYCERKQELANAAKHNFPLLGADNIEVRHTAVGPDNLPKLLSETKADIVFVDPARRSASGSKVFLIEDCTPDVLKLKDIIFEHCRYLVIKLSPMADISMCCNRLGKECRQVNVMGAEGECKELLIIMDRDWNAPLEIRVLEDGKCFRFTPQEEKDAQAGYISSIEDIRSKGLLIEPSKSMLKCGAFKLPCSRFGLKKLAPFTHLYTGADAEDFPSKKYSVEAIYPLNKEGIKTVSALYPHSEVTARNLKMDTETLRKKLKLQSGEDAHIFGLNCDKLGNWLFVCKRK